MFICPVCKNKLNKTGKSLICSNGHCFDMAKSGYVNLLLKSTGGNHGDNKLMVSARRDFLDKGYYEPLREAIVKMCREFTATGDIIVDCGCGEGYYTSKIAEVLPDRTVCGFDISKDALAVAAKRNKTVEYAVASSFDIPLPDSCADMLKAEQTGNNIKMKFPDQPVYVHFYSPRWICRMGNFRELGEAKKVLAKVRALGYRQACLVKGQITVQY